MMDDFGNLITVPPFGGSTIIHHRPKGALTQADAFRAVAAFRRDFHVRSERTWEELQAMPKEFQERPEWDARTLRGRRYGQD